MKKLATVLVLITAVLATALTFSYWWRTSSSAVGGDGEEMRFVVPKGASAESIGNKLKNEDLIKSPLAFKLYLQITDKSKSINSGEFLLSPNMTLAEVVGALRSNPTELWVTIPEGFRREQIAERIASDLGVTSKEIFVSEFLSLTTDLEGQLFPDTYLFSHNASPQSVVSTLSNNFEKKYQQALDDSDTKRSRNDILTMASLIERETITSSERPIVSGILWKRLDNDWLLQVDASVQYVFGTSRCVAQIDCDWWKPPTRNELEVDSPYNTYKSNDLPPTPIANPGYDSIHAAMNPQTSDFWFYIHANGQIHYARTLDEHNSNISRYLN